MTTPKQFTNYQLPEIGFIRLPVILEIYPISAAGWWAGCKKGIYPSPVKLSANVTAWRVDDIRELVARINNQGVAA
jgi:prophage regulatory protein